jgi:hypothetical protein
MAHRPAGRPKATDPKAIKVTVRLTAHEADMLQRVARTGSLSQAIRTALTAYISQRGGERAFPDTPEALLRRELRKAKKAAPTEEATLVQAFALEEPSPPVATPPAPDAPIPQKVPIYNPRTGERGELTLIPVPSAPRVGQVLTYQVPSAPRELFVRTEPVRRQDEREHRRDNKTSKG